MRKQRSSSSAAAAAAVVSLCKVLLMALALICTMHAAPVEGGRAAAAIGSGALDPTYTPRVPRGQPYTRSCGGPYTKCPPPPGAGSP
ncbi:uncharacterized protein LOC102718210 [Oryza brachyantha]|uniref:Uncharacterized protein n=1 Tax=Oryza brachyantha TaxID=4533 RepID=J3N531_ORYBR|nr:uncharacterized protein LOC102718210 [Oryza brachyantha]